MEGITGVWQSGTGSSVASFETRSYGTITISLGAFEQNPGLASIRFDSSDLSNSNGYHEYFSRYDTGISTKEATQSQMINLLMDYPTPISQTFAGPGFVFPAQPIGFDAIVNATVAGWHILDPGVVQRRIIVENGEYFIETVGIGVGAMGQVNTWPILTEPVWDFAGIRLSGQQRLDSLSFDLFHAAQMLPGMSRCFPAHTRIQTSRTTSTVLSALRIGDIVLAFDATADKGRGALVPRRITRLYRNTTTEWLRLRWFDGTAREVITTPGHHFLDELGLFPTIEEMTRTGSATVVLASGALAGKRRQILRKLTSKPTRSRIRGSLIKKGQDSNGN